QRSAHRITSDVKCRPLKGRSRLAAIMPVSPNCLPTFYLIAAIPPFATEPCLDLLPRLPCRLTCGPADGGDGQCRMAILKKLGAQAVEALLQPLLKLLRRQVAHVLGVAAQSAMVRR
ncbi:hypothetical protein, partial [Teichococcus vastitatis]